MYFNGELRQGGDSNHSEIRLLDCAKGGEEFDCCLNAYSDAWEFKGKLRMGARLKVVDDLVNRLIFDLKTPLKVASLYDADDLPRIDIVKALNDAVNLIDFNTADYDTLRLPPRRQSTCSTGRYIQKMPWTRPPAASVTHI